MENFRNLLTSDRVTVVDGAVGTMLYGKDGYMNRAIKTRGELRRLAATQNKQLNSYGAVKVFSTLPFFERSPALFSAGLFLFLICD